MKWTEVERAKQEEKRRERIGWTTEEIRVGWKDRVVQKNEERKNNIKGKEKIRWEKKRKEKWIKKKRKWNETEE